MEEGWAPWWNYEHLRIALFRPLGIAVHTLDFRGFPGNALPMRMHSLAWLGGMVAAATWLYRRALGVQLGGAAALLFALDHTHGLQAGNICNRHALMALLFGALSLGFYLRQRQSGELRDRWQGPLLYVCALLTSEASVAIAGYALGYALFAESGSWRKRALGAAPYVAITLLWRAYYNAAGFGAFGSGAYTDLGREPWAFARTFAERAPLLWVGQFWFPPAEVYVLANRLEAQIMLVWALAIVGVCAWIFAPLLRRDPLARFWTFGMAAALVPASAVFPNNRQLTFVSLGAMGLLAQLWHDYAVRASTPASGSQRWRQRAGALLLGARLVASPLLLPLTTVWVTLTGPLHQGVLNSIGDEVAGRDLILVTAPDYFAVRMLQLTKRLARAPLPRRIRALSCEPEPLRVTRTGARTLDVDYQGGFLNERTLNDLYRDRRLGMPPGTRVSLSGFEVEVLHTDASGLPSRVRFTFARPLEDPSLAFYRWDEQRFVPFRPPALGEQVTVPSPTVRWALE